MSNESIILVVVLYMVYVISGVLGSAFFWTKRWDYTRELLIFNSFSSSSLGPFVALITWLVKLKDKEKLGGNPYEDLAHMTGENINWMNRTVIKQTTMRPWLKED